ncbi:hypothetical protein [Xanthomonas phaseoli]|uniref:Uncharacterized protein n=1 Tax=Xanthomonas manihotis TaxID=43353 RepID=A0A8I1XIS8_XANMN|nr:hypothetical protein [Xanthomonas phaseoli]KUF21079.1 hypothetical protein AO826_15845 [Xanthomonas phaseoli pv. manihotis]MBO9721919.1 hypothetical protein [Xanthomonas phaseoli pv. manihotis]MBO9755161.1 hypothetical protein [Xanthomonas phaseoli pv. manihotis]MBO9758823.1 hypothetical protein [Xanthomonas phaseoli pv. manihotis]MBO9765811.1 hypothetical protein [Xanthomonas phaseoli pv. manihotis]
MDWLSFVGQATLPMCAVLVAWADDGDSAVESVRAGADVRAIRAVSDMPYCLRRILQVCGAGGWQRLRIPCPIATTLQDGHC